MNRRRNSRRRNSINRRRTSKRRTSMNRRRNSKRRSRVQRGGSAKGGSKPVSTKVIKKSGGGGMGGNTRRQTVHRDPIPRGVQKQRSQKHKGPGHSRATDDSHKKWMTAGDKRHAAEVATRIETPIIRPVVRRTPVGNQGRGVETIFGGRPR
jgi:hypothetical protein